VRSAILMGNKTKIAIAVAAVLLLAGGLLLYFHLHQPAKPMRVRRVQNVTEFVGVGLELRADPQAAVPVVQGVVPNSPAAAAGIATGLLVSKVDDVPLAGKSLLESVNLVRGTVGTTVKLELVTPDGSRTNTVELTRQKFTMPAPPAGGPRQP
jgi:C-terminal processing protease CtpA/Prc